MMMQVDAGQLGEWIEADELDATRLQSRLDFRQIFEILCEYQWPLAILPFFQGFRGGAQGSGGRRTLGQEPGDTTLRLLPYAGRL